MFTSEIKIAIKRAIGEGIDQAIKRIEEVLDSASPMYNALVQLKSRYSAYLSSVILGIASQKELDEQYAKLSLALIMLTDLLQDTDLKSGSSASAETSKPRRGELLYYIPREMQEKREYYCTVRIAYFKEILFSC